MDLEDRLKEFTYILVRSFEEKLKYWQKFLEDRPEKLDTSKPGTVFATAVSAIPQVGRSLATVVKQGDQYLQNRKEKETAQTMAEITYFCDNNKDAFRKILIEGAFEIFCRFEYQFSLVTCNGGPLRAMQKLGSDATYRIFSFLLEDKTIKNLTSDIVAKGMVLGKSQRNSKKVITSGRSLVINDENVTTDDFFSRTGIRILEDDIITYYRNKDSVRVLRHRLTFPWEDQELIKSTYEIDNPEYSHKYQFIKRDKEEEVELVRQFVASKNPVEDLKEFIRVEGDELETLVRTATMEIKEVQEKGISDNTQRHYETREVVIKAEESIIAHLNSMILETFKQSLEEDRKKREEYDRKIREEEQRKKEEEDRKRQEEEERKRQEDEARRAREEEERKIREEEERKRKEEAEMLLEKIKEQQDSVVVIDKARIEQEAKRVEDCWHRESKKVEREGRRIVNQVKKLKFKF